MLNLLEKDTDGLMYCLATVLLTQARIGPLNNAPDQDAHDQYSIEEFGCDVDKIHIVNRGVTYELRATRIGAQ